MQRARIPSFLGSLVMKLEGLGATLNVAKPPKGSSVAIFGLGAVGLAELTVWVSLCLLP
ncbi:alcohol dehydrogenase [Carex littledalei]|uniref:Alcohol dehydrogenase n=1 Tax=Carex littledalei TaxID=544730 RepID=A0A833QE01_9POAL|nr:alcohol dehydrogenase [Carex littledalei]